MKKYIYIPKGNQNKLFYDFFFSVHLTKIFRNRKDGFENL